MHLVIDSHTRDVAGPMDTRIRSGWEIKNCHPDTENAMSRIRIRTVYYVWKHQLHAFRYVNLLFHAYLFISPLAINSPSFALVLPPSRSIHDARTLHAMRTTLLTSPLTTELQLICAWISRCIDCTVLFHLIFLWPSISKQQTFC